MREPQAVVECEPTTLAAALRRAVLAGEGAEPREEVFVRVDTGGIETPASGVDATERSFCTFHPSLFDDLRSVDGISALLPVAELLGWLDWFGDSPAVAVELLGQPGAATAEAVRIESGDREVVFDCVRSGEAVDGIECTLPDRFDGTQFLDAGGDPVPTAVETTAGELLTVVEAVARSEGVEHYPLALDAGELRFEVEGDGVRAAGTLDAAADGPGFAARYGPGFERTVRTLDGTVTLQTGPDEPLALVSRSAGATYRHVLSPVEAE